MFSFFRIKYFFYFPRNYFFGRRCSSNKIFSLELLDPEFEHLADEILLGNRSSLSRAITFGLKTKAALPR